MNKGIKKFVVGTLAVLMLSGAVAYAAPVWSQNVNRALHSNGNSRSASLQVNGNHRGVNGIQAQIINLATDQRSAVAQLTANNNATLSGGNTIHSASITATASQVRRGRFNFRMQGNATWHQAPNLDSNQGHH